jgi:transcriptional regulator with XRE-family HTH domain
MNRVRETRIARDMSREALAATAGISYQFVRILESEDPPEPGLGRARNIAKALGKSVDYLFPPVAVAATTGRR